MAALGEIGVRFDPVLNHNFIISLIDSSSLLAIVKSSALSALTDVALGGFSECSGLEMTLDVEEFEEGGNNGTVRKFPSRVKWPNLTLRRGVGTGTTLWDWHYGFVTGTGKRRDGVIALLNDLHLPNSIWYFRRGLPVRYAGPNLDASENSVAIESLEIGHEGLYQLPYVGLGTAAASRAIGVAAGAEL